MAHAIAAVLNQKGGCGKSTTAIHLARYLERQGARVVLVDADPQGSGSRWASGMNLAHATSTTAPELLDLLPALATHWDWIVVDGPPALSDLSQTIALRADLVLVPAGASVLDLNSTQDTVRLLLQARSVRGSDRPRAALLLNRVVRGTRLALQVRSTLRESPVPLLEAEIPQRQAIADAPGQAATVWEMPGAAAREAEAAYERAFEEFLTRLCWPVAPES